MSSRSFGGRSSRAAARRRFRIVSEIGIRTALAAVNYIDGVWVAARSGRTYERRNPWRPSEVVGEFVSSVPEDVSLAVAGSESAWPAWSAMAAAVRCSFLARAAELFEARVEEIAADMAREMG